jgi:large subunit ribosomal protein L10
MLKTEKEGLVAELVERLRTADTLIVADYRGLTHAELDGVRTKLLEHGARFSVVKNTLTRKAADAAGVEALHEFLTGPTAIAFVHDGDMVAVAKTLSDTARTTRRLALKGAVLAGRPVSAGSVQELATLPPLDVLRGQVLGAIVAPLTSLLGLVSAPLQSLVGLIDARVDQLGGAEPADVAESAATEEPPAAVVSDASEAAATASEEPAPEALEEGDQPEADTLTDETPTETPDEDTQSSEPQEA